MKNRMVLIMVLSFALWAMIANQPNTIVVEPLENENLPLDALESNDLHLTSNIDQKITVFNTTGITFDDVTTINPNVNYTNVGNGYYIDETSFKAFNVSLFEDYYINITAYFIMNLNESDPEFSGDIDMDILFRNGTMWFSAQSNNHHEVIGPTLIPEDGTYVIILYPYTGALGSYTDPQNGTVDGLYVQMMDHATAVLDSNLNMDNDTAELFFDRVPEIHAEKITQLWEPGMKNDVFQDMRNPDSQFKYYYHWETYKVWLHEGSTVDFSITYNPLDISGYSDVDTTPMLVLFDFNEFVEYVIGRQALINNQTTDYPSVSTLYWGTNNITFGASPILWGSHLNVNITNTGWYLLVFSEDIADFNLDIFTTTFEFNLTTHFFDSYDLTEKPNDVWDLATNLGSDSTSLEGLVSNSTDDDYFFIDGTSKTRLIVDIEYDRLYGAMNLFVFNRSLKDSNGDESVSLVESSIDPTQNVQRIELLIFVDQYFFIKINSSSPYGNWYTLNITIAPIDDDYEPNDKAFDAARLPGTGFYELFLAKGNADMFSLFLFNGDRVTVTLKFNGLEANINLYIYTSNIKLVDKSTSATSDQEEVIFIATGTDIYLIQVYAFSSSFTNPGLDYNMTISIEERDDQFEPNDNALAPSAIQDGSFSELILRAGDEDWYRINLKAGEYLTVTAEFDAEQGDLDIILYDLTTANILASSQSFVEVESFSYEALVSTDYLLRVVLFDGHSVVYHLNIEFEEIGDNWEDNDLFVQAKDVNATSYINIEARGGDYDYYRITVPKDYALIAELTHASNLNYELSVFTPQQAIINRSEGHLTTEIVGPFGVTSSGEYYIVVHMKSFGLTSYSLNLTVGLTTVLIPPPVVIVGSYVLPAYGFNASLISPTIIISTGISITTSTGTTLTNTTMGGISLGNSLMFAGAGMGLGAGGTGLGTILIRRRKG
ncbi:MAG: hypothetical protein ACXAC7_01060 [Candidatus Hodarchaeales archaeon]|jgi:hypothetical protein